VNVLQHQIVLVGTIGGTRRRVLGATFPAFISPLVLLMTSKFYWATLPDSDRILWAVVCTSGCLLSLGIVAWVLAPIGVAARTARDLVDGAELQHSTPARANELTGLLADIGVLAACVDDARGRLADQHPTPGFPTRVAFLAELGVEMARGCEPTLLALVRMGDFDRMADFDRRAAELALDAFGARLKASADKTLGLAQVDRDCFAIWFRAIGLEEAIGELRAIAYVLGQDLSLADHKVAPEVTIGCAVYPHDAQDPAALLACTFAASPKTGTAQADDINFFSSITRETARQSFLMEQSLRSAINDNQFFVHYQPVVDLSLRQVVGAEALLRWRHPELGLVPPAKFIPILEQSGMIDEVGLWVLNAACREASAWRRRGLGDLTLAVNFSAVQFRSPHLAMTVARTLERHRLAPGDLEVELTETAAMQDTGRTRKVLEQLYDLGVGVAIDDFGTGHSSLSYLKNLPFTKLKIDREFVAKVHERPDSQAICSALIALADGLNIKLLAEGVEEQEEVETLTGLGCALYQGYFFARPQSANDFVDLVSNSAWLDAHDLSRAGPASAPKRRRA
jgi:predicted signal transduction protein with EAL and GGDEF domain